ncbi:MAG: archaeosortase/exosortase family protein, partial [Planctomycetes bacterium]|nr:archaeosortase/exosortase family protein [Planctomycetota bacterium]
MNKIGDINVIILAGSRDFGRCPVTSCLPVALWPVVGEPAVERLLRLLAKQGIRHATICSNGDTLLLKKTLTSIDSMQVTCLDEPLPVGPAGCVRDAANQGNEELFLILPAAITSPPDIDSLLRIHRAGGSQLTVMLEEPSCDAGPDGPGPGIYVCDRSILRYIPQHGYSDIKEGVIPEMLKAGGTIHSAKLDHSVGSFRDRAEYLLKIGDYLDNVHDSDIPFPHSKLSGSKNIRLAQSAEVHPDARLYGPVVIMDDAVVAEKAVIFGPTVIGRGVTVGKNSLIVNSALWDGCRVGEDCQIRQCIVDFGTEIGHNSIIQEKAIPFKEQGMLRNSLSSALASVGNAACSLQRALRLPLDKLNDKLPDRMKSHGANILPWFAGGLILVAFLWSYWSVFRDLWQVWQQSDEYSSGLLVPFLAVYILWSRRADLAQCTIRPSLWGLFAFLAAQAFRFFGLFLMFGSAERLSVVLSIASIVLLLFGWQVFRKVFSILIFLGLMLPLPRRIHYAVMLPLQSWATSSAVFFLEMLGYHVMREGNIIHL